jgi:hypothetical protein
MNHTPDSGFEFPADKRDQIDALLRQPAEPQRLRSVRPDRNPVVTPVAVPTPVVQNVAVESPPITPKSDPEGISIDLPSRFFYYDFKDLYVKPFRVRHLAKVAKAHEQSSLQILAEVVSSVLSTSTGDVPNLAFQLSMADFTYVLYWLRLNSFNKPQMRVVSQCTNPDHIHAVETGAKTKESLAITTIYKESMMEVTYLEQAPDPQQYKIVYNGQELQLRPETVMDVVQFLDNDNWQDAEFQFQARVASVVASPGMSLVEKIQLVEDLDPDQALLALEFAELVDAYGVVETINTNCIGCGASGLVKIAVDAPSFLSPQF